jgi:hypothetical protein
VALDILERKVKPGIGPLGYSKGCLGLLEPCICCTQTL